MNVEALLEELEDSVNEIRHEMFGFRCDHDARITAVEACIATIVATLNSLTAVYDASHETPPMKGPHK